MTLVHWSKIGVYTTVCGEQLGVALIGRGELVADRRENVTCRECLGPPAPEWVGMFTRRPMMREIR